MSRRTEKPLPVGNAQFGGQRYPTILPDADVNVTWAHRNRLDTVIRDQNAPDSPLGLGATTVYEYTFSELDTGTPGAQLRQATTTSTSFLYTRAQMTTDNGGTPPQAIRTRIRSKDTVNGIDSRVDVVRDFEVFAVGTKSVDLNGTDEALRSTAAAIGIVNVWSLALWVKRTDADTDQRVLCSIGDPTGANSIHLIRPSGSSADLLVEVRDSAGTLFKARTAAGVLTASAWRHVVVTFDGAAGGDPLVVYVDGVSQSLTGTDNTGTMTDTSRRICLGSDSALANFAAGRFHALGIWSGSVHTQAEVTGLYNSGNGSDFNLNYNHNGYVSRADLEQWFRLGEDSSPDADIGKQYSLAPTGTHNLMEAHQNVAAADVVTDAP
jgi:hypothetical protein